MTPKELYAQFLQSKFWINLSRQKRKMVGRCERCGSRKCLQSHHRFYREDWNLTQLEDLEVLCRKCHSKHHGIKTVSRRDKAKLKSTAKSDAAMARLKKGCPKSKDITFLRSLGLIDRATWDKWKPIVKKQDHAPRESRWRPGMYEGITSEQAFQQIGKSTTQTKSFP